MSTPLSPGAESREKDRVELVFKINAELFYESSVLATNREELKKLVMEKAKEQGGSQPPNRMFAEEDAPFKKDYFE